MLLFTTLTTRTDLVKCYPKLLSEGEQGFSQGVEADGNIRIPDYLQRLHSNWSHKPNKDHLYTSFQDCLWALFWITSCFTVNLQETLIWDIFWLIFILSHKMNYKTELARQCWRNQLYFMALLSCYNLSKCFLQDSEIVCLQIALHWQVVSWSLWVCSNTIKTCVLACFILNVFPTMPCEFRFVYMIRKYEHESLSMVNGNNKTHYGLSLR